MNSASIPIRPPSFASSRDLVDDFSRRQWPSPIVRSRRSAPSRPTRYRLSAPRLRAVDAELRVHQVGTLERFEEAQQQRAAVAAAAGAACARQGRRDEAAVGWRALAERDAREARVVLDEQPQRRVPAVLLDRRRPERPERLRDVALDVDEGLLHQRVDGHLVPGRERPQPRGRRRRGRPRARPAGGSRPGSPRSPRRGAARGRPHSSRRRTGAARRLRARPRAPRPNGAARCRGRGRSRRGARRRTRPRSA